MAYRAAGGSRLVVLPGGKQIATTRSGFLDLWDLDTGRLAASAETVGSVVRPGEPATFGLSAAADGKSLVLLQAGRAYRYALPLKEPFLPLPSPGERESILAVAFGSSGDIVFAVSSAGRLLTWKPGDRAWTDLRLARTGPVRFPLTGPALVAGGGVLATAASDGKIRLWDANQGKELDPLDAPDLHSLAVSGNGKLLATSRGRPMPGAKHTVEIRDIREAKRISSWESTFHPHLVFSPDGSVIAACSREDDKIDIRDVQTGKSLRTLIVPGDVVREYQFLPDGSGLVTLGRQGVIGVWDHRTGKPLRTTPGHTGQVRSVVFAPDGGWITAGDDWTVRRWDASGKEVGRFEGHGREVTSLVLAPDRKTLFTGSLDGTVRVWDAAKGTELRRHSEAPLDNGVHCLALSADGKTLAASVGYSVRLLDAATLKQTAVLTGDAKSGAFRAVGFLSGNRLATRAGRVVQVWNVATGNEAYRLDRSENVGGSLVWAGLAAAPDGKRFALPLEGRAAGKNKPAYLGMCEVDTGKVIDRIEVGPATEVSSTAVAYLPDGKAVVVGDTAGKVHLIDLEGKAVRRTFEGHRGPVLCLAVAPDGKTVASGGADTTVLVWDLAEPAP